MARIAGTLWDNLPLRRTRAAPDPDAAPRAVAVPFAWEEDAAEALAALQPGSGPVALPTVAERWIGRVVARGQKLGRLAGAETAEFAESLRRLLLTRRGAPGATVWCNEAKPEPRFVLNLPTFLDEAGSFDAPGFAHAAATGVRLLDILTGGRAARLQLGFADLAGMLAACGLAYDSEAGRDVAAGVTALLRGAAEAESGRLAERHGALEPVALFWPAPPRDTALPGLAAAAQAALDEAAACPGRRHAALLALHAADAVEALLGAETGGLSPAGGHTRLGYDATGELVELPTRAALRAGARAAVLLAPPDDAARTAMGIAVAPFLHADPPAPVALPEPAHAAPRLVPRQNGSRQNGSRQVGPRRHTGAVWRVAVGGHKVALRTTEDADGRLVEVAFGLSKESAAFRSLMECFAQSVTIGLQGGVALEEYVEAYAYTRFGPSGAVDGDPAIGRATSVLDWAFRRLALDYLGRRDLHDPSEADCDMDAVGSAHQQSLPLPLEMPAQPGPRARRRALRLVG